MEIVENKILNVVFQVAITIGLAGLGMLLIQEIVALWAVTATAYTVILIIADFIGITSLITFGVWMYLSVNRDLTLNIALIMSAVFVLLYAFAHFFVLAVSGVSTGSVISDYTQSGVSLIGLVAVVLLSGLMIAVFILRFIKRDGMPVYEQFALLVWVLVIAIYDFSGFYYAKQTITYGISGTLNEIFLGITFLPRTLELIFLLFAALLIIYKLFGKMDAKAEKILLLTLINVIFLSLAIGTVNGLGITFSNTARIPFVIGAHFIMASCLAVMITTFIMLIKEYPVRSRSR
jgi:hypothetical protein